MSRDALRERRPESPSPSIIMAAIAIGSSVMSDERSIAAAESAVAASSTTPRLIPVVSPAMKSDPSSAPIPIMLMNVPSSLEPPWNTISTYAGMRDRNDIDDIVVAMTSSSRNRMVRLRAEYRSPSHTELSTFCAFPLAAVFALCMMGMFPVRKKDMSIMAEMMMYVGPGPSIA